MRRDAMAIAPGSPADPGGSVRLPPRHDAHHYADVRVGADEMIIVNPDRPLATPRRLRGAVTPCKPPPPLVTVHIKLAAPKPTFLPPTWALPALPPAGPPLPALPPAGPPLPALPPAGFENNNVRSSS
jgi:hypothetical protein